MYLIGYDIGSSSVKACVVDAQTGKTLSTAFYPKQEAPILSLKAGWAEQEPESWWNYLKSATAEAMAAAAEKAGRPVSARGLQFYYCSSPNSSFARFSADSITLSMS